MAEAPVTNAEPETELAPESATEETPEVEETPEGERDEKDEETEEGEGEEAEKPKAEPVDKTDAKIQARFDQLTAKLYQQEQEIQRLRTAKPEESKPPEWTKETVASILADDSKKEYHPWAINKMVELVTEEKIGSLRSEQTAKQEASEAQVKSMSRAMEEFPDLADKASEMWKEANEIYVSQNLASYPNGQYLAALQANHKLTKSNAAPVKKLQRALDKERAKKSMSTGGKAVVANDKSVLDKLEAKAIDSGESNDWLAYNRKREEVLKKQKK